MIHRGPDAEGIWRDAEVGLAFRRLAIIDLDERSNQPLHLGGLHLVFNGEIYNYVELRAELRGLGHMFETEGDGEVLIHAWAEWGEDSLERLNGMFAFAIWDAGPRVLTMAVDRFAEKPLFFHRTQDGILFASDVRALRAADPAIGVPDENAAARFFALGAMPVLPATFFADVQRLPPAHVARWSQSDGFSTRQWWEPEVIDVPGDVRTAAIALRGLLRESVALRLRSDVPVGTSLSGGVDSSAVVAVSSELAGEHRTHAFTATFQGFDRDEWRYADEVARAARVICHHAVRPQVQELFDELPALVAAQEEPFGSTSIYAQWSVMRAAREAGVVVMLDGQGADELFGGYPGIEGWALRSLGLPTSLRAISRDRSKVEAVARAYGAGKMPRAIARLHRLRHVSPYVSRWLASEVSAHTEQPTLDWSTTGSPLRRELLNQAFRTSLPQLCRFADRDSMAFGVEIRLPFLDYRIATFALSLPTDFLWRSGVSKFVLREAFRGIVPESVLARRDKIGFETPESAWFGSDVGRARVAEILLDEGTKGPWVRAEIERDVIAGTWRDTSSIWRAVNVALWLDAARTSLTRAR